MKMNIKDRTCPSADKPLESFIAGLDHDTAHHRMQTQSLKCGFGLQGVCCRLCANGPCRITPDAPKGVCGATEDVIVARNFLRTVAGGSACYIHIVENAAWNLKRTGENKGKIKGEKTLDRLCKTFGIEAEDKYEKAEKLGQLVIDDLYKPQFEEMELVEKMAYGPRVENWRKLNLMPSGSKSEVFNALVKSSTNLNSDPIDMLLHVLRLGISTGLYGLTLTNLLNDIMLGEPEIRPVSVGFRVIDEDYINVMVTGHQHSLLGDLQEALVSEEAVQLAESSGAKGFRIVGTTCVGQDLQLRSAHNDEVFSGHAGNNFTSEALLATGAVDIVVSEFNCTFPGLEPIAEDLDVKMICIDDVAKKPSAEYLKYSYAERENISKRIIEEALKSYESRRGNVKLTLPENHGNDDTITGVTENSLRDFLGGSYQPLVDLIASGDIKGVVGVVGCSNLVSGGHDVFTVGLAKKLIANDMIVLSAGCSSGGLENAGLMSPGAADLAGDKLGAVCRELGIPPVLNFGPCLSIGRLELVATELAAILDVDLPELPLIISAPQWLEEQAVADGSFALALGLNLHVAKPLYITGSKVVTDTLTNGLEKLTGGKLIMNDDIDETAELFDEIIMEKRKSLGL